MKLLASEGISRLNKLLAFQGSRQPLERQSSRRSFGLHLQKRSFDNVKDRLEPKRPRLDTKTFARRGAALRELEEALQEDKSPKADVPVVTKLEWQSPLQIVKYPDPRLRRTNAKIGVFDESLQQLGRELLETMYHVEDGVGLAAPQVGLNLRLMVFNPTGIKGEPEYVLVNPRIVSSNARTDRSQEGCLSFPSILGDVERPTQVSIKAQTVHGGKVGLSLKGWQARLFQHEYDHLEGVLFHDRMSPEVLQKVKPKLQSLEKEFSKLHPDVLAESVA